MLFSLKRFVIASLVFTFFLSPLPLLKIVAQTNAANMQAFTVDDIFKINSIYNSDLSENGRWLAVTFGALGDRIGINNHRFGDPTYIAPSLVDFWIIDTKDGKSRKIFENKRQVRGLSWSPDNNNLAFFVRNKDQYAPMIWSRSTGKLMNIKLPTAKISANNAVYVWSSDGEQLLFAVTPDTSAQKAAKKFQQLTAGPVVVQSSKESFLSWDDLRRMSILRSLVSYNVKHNTIREVLPEMKISNYALTGDSMHILFSEDITKKTDYDVIGGADNQILLMPLAGGAKRTIIKSTKGMNITWSSDNLRYAYAKDGVIFVGNVYDTAAKQLTGKKPAFDKDSTAKIADNSKMGDAIKDTTKKEKEKFSVLRLSSKGDWLVASNKEGLWLMNSISGAKEMIVKIPEEDKEAPRYQVVDWSPGADSLYLSYASRTRWERGLVRYNLKTKKLEDVIKDSLLYSGFRVSKNGSTFLYNSSQGNRSADMYAADAGFKNIRRLTDLNTQMKNKKLSKTQLVQYLDADGNKTYGVLYHPVDYEPGKKYPTIFNLYEQFFDDDFNASINILTSNGYAVMQPSVTLETGYPGEAWVKGVTSAANKLIEMGIADPDRLGVQGVSYGGYATNLLITQTNRFKAAINISGKVNMVSFYTASPRIGVRNIHAPEKSQDRLGATLWQQPQKYIQQSAIMFADRIKTPLLLISGEQDHNVPAEQSMEMFYALRRLGKEVEWVSYVNGGHGMPTTTADEVKDYHKRIIEWYDSHLKGELKIKAEDK